MKPKSLGANSDNYLLVTIIICVAVSKKDKIKMEKKKISDMLIPISELIVIS